MQDCSDAHRTAPNVYSRVHLGAHMNGLAHAAGSATYTAEERRACMPASAGGDLDERLDLDRAVERQRRHTDGCAGVAAGVAEDLAE